MTTETKLAELDARALAVGWTLSTLAVNASVSPGTMAKLRRNPSSVRVRIFSKLELALSKREAERATA